jgi:hypothetical protein
LTASEEITDAVGSRNLSTAFEALVSALMKQRIAHEMWVRKSNGCRSIEMMVRIIPSSLKKEK